MKPFRGRKAQDLEDNSDALKLAADAQPEYEVEGQASSCLPDCSQPSRTLICAEDVCLLAPVLRRLAERRPLASCSGFQRQLRPRHNSYRQTVARPEGDPFETLPGLQNQTRPRQC